MLASALRLSKAPHLYRVRGLLSRAEITELTAVARTVMASPGGYRELGHGHGIVSLDDHPEGSSPAMTRLNLKLACVPHPPSPQVMITTSDKYIQGVLAPSVCAHNFQRLLMTPAKAREM